MAFTTEQLTLIRAAIDANPAWSSLPINDDTGIFIAQEMNKPKVPTSLAWHSAAVVDDIINAITWANYTPNDKITTDAEPTLSQKIGRILEIQVKQMNLQLMLQGRLTIDCTHPTLRTGLRDAVIQVPSGAGGAAVNPGGTSGVTVMNACTRPASFLEDLLSTATETTGTVTAKVLAFEGQINNRDVEQARLL